jgi:hypothetical protein
MTIKSIALAGISAAFLAIPAWAHHSFAMFDQTVEIEMDATVTYFEWINPHSWLHFSTMAESGGTEDWSLELASIGQQVRAGWTADTLEEGDEISVVFNPLRDGTRGGTLVSVVLPNGETLEHGGMAVNPLGNN